MATRPKKSGFHQLAGDLKNNDMSNVVFFYGKEDFLIQWAKKQIIGHFIHESTKALDLTLLEEGHRGVEKIIEVGETLPLFSKRKVLILENFSPLLGKREVGFTDENLERLVAFFRRLPSTTQVVLTAGALPDGPRQRKKPAFFQQLEDVGTGYHFDALGMDDLKKFIAKRLSQHQKKASTAVIDELITQSGYLNEAVDYQLAHLEKDLDKIVALSSEEIITQEDIDGCVSDHLEHNTFKMLDAISNNRKDEAFRLVHDLLHSGVNEFLLLGNIISQLEIMLQVKELRNEGHHLKQMQSILSIHEFRIKKALKFATGYSEEKLARMLMRALEMEQEMKSGRLKKQYAMEILIGEI